jgi:hypothetical protein
MLLFVSILLPAESLFIIYHLFLCWFQKRCSVRLCRRANVLYTYSGVQHILCCVLVFCLRLVHSGLPVSLECPFVIVSSLFSNIYSSKDQLLSFMCFWNLMFTRGIVNLKSNRKIYLNINDSCSIRYKFNSHESTVCGKNVLRHNIQHITRVGNSWCDSKQLPRC